MKKYFALLVFVVFVVSCAPQAVDVETGALPKSDANTTNSSYSESASIIGSQQSATSLDNPSTNMYYNEIAYRFPFLYSDLLPKLRSLGYSHILMKRQPFFGFKVETAGMEWIIKSFTKRRKHLIDTVSLMVSVGFTKCFNHEGIKFTFTDADDQDVENAEVADAILVVEGYLNVKPLTPLGITGMEYLLRLNYDVQAYIIDVAKNSKVWIGSTEWRRNLFVTSMD